MISAVITVYKSWPLAIKCLAELNRLSDGLLQEIIVIDDCPEDPVPWQVAKNPQLILVKHHSNLGYVNSVNEGFTRASADIIILLDSDAFTGTSLAVLQQHFDADPMLGLAGFRTLNAQGIESGGIGPEPDAWFLVAGQEIEKWLKLLFPSLSQREMVMHSHAFAVRKKMVQEIGGFDAQRFQFYEADNDFSIRVNQHPRWQLRQLRDFDVYHDGGSSPILTSKRVIHMYESRWLLLKKFNRIRWPWLLKTICGVRLSAEWLMIAVFGRLVYSAIGWKDKLYSRRHLLSQLSKW